MEKWLSRSWVLVTALSILSSSQACSDENKTGRNASRERAAREDAGSDAGRDAGVSSSDEDAAIDASAAADASAHAPATDAGAPAPAADANAPAPAADSGTPRPDDAAAPPKNAFGGCPVHVSVVTSSYGTGNNDDDDYAPNNVGAVWITDPQGAFIRTVAVWGPGYWNFAETWVKQSNGSRVDIVSGATRKNHAIPVEADWDCKDKNGARVPAGSYRLNVEFTEAEMQGPLLTRDSSLPFTLGDDAKGVMREPGNSFGPIDVRVSP